MMFLAFAFVLPVSSQSVCGIAAATRYSPRGGRRRSSARDVRNFMRSKA
jgi:hypothetical protein